MEEQGFPVLVKDASLGVDLPGDVRHVDEPADRRRLCLVRCTPKLRGGAGTESYRSCYRGAVLKGLNDLPQPTFVSNAVTEPNNFVEHFIDSSGVVSWRFFSAKANVEFVEWDFSGQGENSNAEKPQRCSAFSKTWAKRCTRRCMTSWAPWPAGFWCPGYSEVYPVEDLIWDNTNKALLFRADILNLHRLDDAGPGSIA